MYDSCKSLSDVVKMFPAKSLDSAELVLELSFQTLFARTEVESNEVISRTIFKELFRKINAVKSMFPAL